jgi:DNA gyrase subunit A
MAIIKRDITDLQSEKSINYAVSIIMGRQVANVFDGLKPVQRRILWSMISNGQKSDKPHRKSAKVVGDVIGTYHPHGDSSVYDALVRMTQKFTNNIPLLDPHGNYGNMAGDPAAAMRYTEVRLAKDTERYLLEGINKNAVPMTLNFDNSEYEPIVLPAKIPFVLINGGVGIASGGYASSIPQFNPNSVFRTIIKAIENPDISVKEIIDTLEIDYPTGGIIGRKGVEQALTTGRGNFRYRCRIEEKKGDLVITEIQFGKSSPAIIESIVNKAKKTKENPNPILHEIVDIKDNTGQNASIHIKLKKGSDPHVVMNKLYKHTLCEDTEKIIMLMTTFDDYKIFNIKEVVQEWIAFRKSTIKRTVLFEIRKYKNRIHIIEGLLKALDNIDTVIKTIKKSKNAEEAKIALIKNYKLSEVQATHIVDMKLSRLTNMGVGALKDEKKDLDSKVADLIAILENPKSIDNMIIQDQKDAMERFKKHTRRTELTDIDLDVTDEDVIKDEDFVLTISNDGYIRKMQNVFKAQKRGGKGVSIKNKEGDYTKSIITCNSKDNILAFTSEGTVQSMKVYQLDESSKGSIGKNIKNYINAKSSVESILCIPTKEFDSEVGQLLFVSRKGLVKRTPIKDFKNCLSRELIATKLKDGDSILDVIYISEKDMKSSSLSLMLTTDLGLGIRISLEDVPVINRTTYGRMAISLSSEFEDSVASSHLIADKDEKDLFLMTVTTNGLGKRTEIEGEFPIQQPRGKGRIATKLRDDSCLVKSLIVDGSEDIIIVTTSKTITVKAEEFNKQLRPSYGHKIINLGKEDYVIDVGILTREQE